MRKINFRNSGFSVPELMIAAGISVVLVGGSAYTFKKFYQTQKQEAMKSKSVEGITLAKQLISKDLSNALKILGSSSKIYKPVSRPYSETTGAEDPYDPSSNDTLVIMKEVFGDLAGDIEMKKYSSASTNDYYLYYKKDNSAKDTYFLKAFQSRRYFVVTNAENRNLFKREGNVVISDDCPSLPLDNGMCHRIRVQVAGGAASVGMKDSEVNRIGSQVRVAEQIRYFVQNGTLYRSVDGDPLSANWKVILPDVQSFQVKYDFKPVEGTGRKSTIELKQSYSSLPLRIRSPKDGVYLSALTAANASGSSVTFEDVDRVEIALTQNIRGLDYKTVNITGNSGFSVANNIVTFTSILDQRPGENTGTDQLDAGVIVGICDIPEKARCNPTCAYKFTTSNRQYHYQSNLCKCGWDPVEGQFYDPDKYNQTKVPKQYNVLIPSGATLKNSERIDACASYYDCLNGPKWIRDLHPGCRVVKQCINNLNSTPSLHAQLYSRPVAYESLPGGGINFDMLQDIIEAADPDNGNATANKKLRCGTDGGGLYVSECDTYYGKFASGLGRSIGSQSFAEACSCAVRDWSTDGNVSSNPRDPYDINWAKICSVNAGNRCSNTWNSTAGQEGYKLRSASNPQGLTYTMAGLCSCSKLAAPPRSGLGESARFGALNLYFFRDFRRAATPTLIPPDLPNEIAFDTLGAGGGDLATNCIPVSGTQTSWTCGSTVSYVIPGDAALTGAIPPMTSFEVDPGRRVTAPTTGILNAWNPATNSLISLSGSQCVDMESNYILEIAKVGKDAYDVPSFCTVDGQFVSLQPVPGFAAAGILKAADLGAEGPALWPYRFFCHPDCGNGKDPDENPSYKHTALTKERNYYRKKFLAKGVPVAACQNQRGKTTKSNDGGGGEITSVEIGSGFGSIDP